jgi:hypothetical protein
MNPSPLLLPPFIDVLYLYDDKHTNSVALSPRANYTD